MTITKKNHKLICCNLSKQKVLDSSPKANQQMEFIYKLDTTVVDNNNNTTAQILTVLEKEKQATLEFRNVLSTQ